MSTDRTPGIDWAALAQEADDAYDNADPSWSHAERCQESARAVVAAYREQQRARGIVEVRRDLLDLARSSLATHEDYSGGEIFGKEIEEIDVILGDSAP